MHLNPREQERLLLASAATLARRRLERGSLLGATEAIALICDEVCEWAWDNVPIDEIVLRAKALLGSNQLLPGVAGVVPVIQVEALFPHGTALVHIASPFGVADASAAGAVLVGAGSIELVPGHERRVVQLTNTGDRSVWISSHFPLDQMNRAIRCEPPLPWGYRLDLPSGEAVAIGPGETKELRAVTFARADDSRRTR